MPGRCRWCSTRRNKVRVIDPKLLGNSVDLALLVRRNRVFGRRQGEEAPHQGELLVVARQVRKLPRHEIVGSAAKEQIAGLRQLHDDHRLILRELSMLAHERFHRPGFLGRDVPVGAGDTSEQIREGGEIARAIGLEMIECLERLAQRRELTLLGRVDTQPGTNRFQRHVGLASPRSSRRNYDSNGTSWTSFQF